MGPHELLLQKSPVVLFVILTGRNVQYWDRAGDEELTEDMARPPDPSQASVECARRILRYMDGAVAVVAVILTPSEGARVWVRSPWKRWRTDSAAGVVAVG